MIIQMTFNIKEGTVSVKSPMENSRNVVLSVLFSQGVIYFSQFLGKTINDEIVPEAHEQMLKKIKELFSKHLDIGFKGGDMDGQDDVEK